MVRNPLIPQKNPTPQFIDLKKSAGILDDYAVRKNVATREGTITKVPTADYDIVNKAYIDSIASFIVVGTGGYATIQEGLDAVGSSGGTVYVKSGTYTITTGLLIKKSSTRLILDGGALVQCNGANVATLLTVDTTGLSRIEVRGGKWLQTNATAQGVCFDLSDTPNHWCGEMRIEEFGTAIKITDATSTSFYSQWENVQCFNCNNGILLSGTQPNNNVFTNIRIRPKAGGAGIGISLIDTRGATFLHCDAEPATGTGITGVNIDATSRENTFVNCWIEGNATGVNIASGAKRSTFIGCSITSNTSDLVDAGTASCFINTSLTGVTKTEMHSDGNLIIDAATLLTLGVAGDIELGDSTLRTIKPSNDEKISIGNTSNRYLDLYMAGDLDMESGNIITDTTTGVKIATSTSQKISFFNQTPIVQPSAYTQTYSTASKTVANNTSAAVATTASTNIAPFGYTTAAQADAIVTAINALRTDVDNSKKATNQIIDDLQSLGLVA